MVAWSTMMRKVGKRKIGEKVWLITPLCRRRQIWVVRAHLCDVGVCRDNWLSAHAAGRPWGGLSWSTPKGLKKWEKSEKVWATGRILRTVWGGKGSCIRYVWNQKAFGNWFGSETRLDITKKEISGDEHKRWAWRQKYSMFGKKLKHDIHPCAHTHAGTKQCLLREKNSFKGKSKS